MFLATEHQPPPFKRDRPKSTILNMVSYSSSSQPTESRDPSFIVHLPLVSDAGAQSNPHQPSPKLASFFSQSQLALALAIQKSKPEAISTRGNHL